jgi:hypothetical protein
MNYLVFNHNQTFLGQYMTFHDAQTCAMTYMGMTGNPAYVTLLSTLTKYEKESYKKLSKLLEIV